MLQYNIRFIQRLTHYTIFIMIKKVALLLLVLTGIIPTACVCPEDPSGPYLLHLNQVFPVSETYITKPLVAGQVYRIAPNETYTEDTLLLELYFDYQFAQNNSDFALYASALALSCPFYPNYEQLNDKIIDITIISDMPFNGVNPGEPLNAKVVLYDENNDALLPLSQAISIINSINGNEFMNRGLGTLVITEKPAGTYEHTFSVKITYESGKEETAESSPVTW